MICLMLDSSVSVRYLWQPLEILKSKNNVANGLSFLKIWFLSMVLLILIWVKVMRFNMKIHQKYEFQKYPSPKVGVFCLNTYSGEYCLKNGWQTSNIEKTIIGETKDSYITELMQSENGFWIGDKVVKEKIITPHGIHKSRLVNWTAGQLTFF